MLGLLLTIIGVGLLIAFISWPVPLLFMILRGKREFYCLSCGMLSRSYPPLRMAHGFRRRCAYCGQRTLIPSDLPAAQEAMGKSATPPAPLTEPEVSRRTWRIVGWGIVIVGGVFILLVIIGNLLPSTPNQTDASAISTPPTAICASTERDGIGIQSLGSLASLSR